MHVRNKTITRRLSTAAQKIILLDYHNISIFSFYVFQRVFPSLPFCLIQFVLAKCDKKRASE